MSRNVGTSGGGGSGSTSAAAAGGSKNKGRRSSSSEPRASSSKPSQPRPASSARTSPTTTYVSGFSPAVAPRPRPTSQPSRQTSLPATAAQPRSPRQPTPASSAPSSRRSSVVDSAAYRYSLNVGSVSRFPGSSTEGANQILRAAARNDPAGAEIDPGRSSVGSTISRTSSRLSSRYTAEEVAPQRRPVYLALPSDPSAKGVWSFTGSTLVASAAGAKDEIPKGGKKDSSKGGKDGEGKRRNSKIMTSFPFPHPVTPRRRTGGTASTDAAQNGHSTSKWRLSSLNAGWQRLLTAIFAGPYERQLNREEQEDDLITQSIIHDIARRNGNTSTAYGTLPIPADPEDPYGYRQLAGPHLLPSYTTDLVARRRERRRARSRARFQCMASWTIWTVSVVLVLIVVVLVFSFVFPDRLDIPNHSDEGEGEDALKVGAIGRVVVGGLALMQHRRPV
ncbi:hypothetical protein PHBOTO_002196 [Pseudozyma hubeiensis]|nr:hypothetical protein PHBOTO_002196 [Pseudozyma hubeiensis]